MKEYKFKIGDKEYLASVAEQENGGLEVTVDGKIYNVELPDRKPAPKPVVKHPAAAAPVAPVAPAPVAQPSAGASSVVAAPLNGKITQVNVKPGDQVTAGQAVVVLEAMKMENDITSEYAGTVKAVLVSAGDQVDTGQALVELA